MVGQHNLSAGDSTAVAKHFCIYVTVGELPFSVLLSELCMVQLYNLQITGLKYKTGLLKAEGKPASGGSLNIQRWRRYTVAKKNYWLCCCMELAKPGVNGLMSCIQC